jgi:hypothetical protein
LTCFLVQDACWLLIWAPASFPWFERGQSSPYQMLCLCTSLVMQAIHADVYGAAWTKIPAGCCNGVQQHAAGGGQSQIVASLNVVNLHFFGDASSSRKGLQYSIDQSPGDWWLVPIQHSRGGRSLHQRLSLGTSLDMHAFHEEISTAAWSRPHGGWWLVSCGAPVVGERSQLTDTLPNPAPALLWICMRCMKRYTMPHAPNTWW